jgi:transcriptional regulator with GAF, ATPase, and Fis domain
VSARDLLAELEALVAAARESGALAGLAPALEAALAEARAGNVAGAEPAPVRYGMVGASPAMQEVFATIERVAASDVPVLVRGETGTGKELVARALHEHGARAGKPLLAENCAAVPANLLESELFGHAKGSFTGAVADRKGHFEAASGGTVFLDEIGDMPLEMQAKLLRVLQEGEVRPVGSNEVVEVDVRVVAATHRDLSAMVAERTFREDLYYRLAVVTIELPPLSEREGDVRLLVEHLIGPISEEIGRPGARVTEEAMQVLERAPWPGNVRQLENELRRAVALSAGDVEPGGLSPELLADA